MTAAQEYSIRANRGLNLRAAPSLNADIVGTAMSGDVLRVVGHSGAWLQVSKGAFQAWLADWVNFSRLDTGSQPPSPAATSAIDNCCFINRQCSSNQEWIDGYWAYQKRLCPASGGSAPQTTSQPTPNRPADVDNCCFVDRQCQSDADWTRGYWDFQNNLCGGPMPEAFTEISIEGSEAFVARIRAALDLLRLRAPQWHAYVTKGPLSISESHPGAADGYAHANSIFISPSAAAKPAHTLAHLLVHEACHVQRTLAGLFRYATELEQNLEESVAGYVASVMSEQIDFGRVFVHYTPSQVARLIRDGRLEQRASRGLTVVTYLTREAGQLLRAGIDVFGAVRGEIARAASLLH